MDFSRVVHRMFDIRKNYKMRSVVKTLPRYIFFETRSLYLGVPNQLYYRLRWLIIDNLYTLFQRIKYVVGE